MPPVKEDEKSLKEKLRAKALDMYENELHVPPALDLGLKSGSRSQLRVVCRTVVLESSQITKRKYSHSNLSSGEWSNKGDDKNTDDAITRLRSLQKERLIISRMGFADRAKQLDVEIEEMRVKAADAKAAREQTLLQENLEILERKMNRKKDRMEVIMNSETVKLEQALNKEFRKMRNRQRQEFLRVLENAERRAMGKVKKCNCGNWYLCRHNKTASYNTRRPAQEVIQYRRNSKRLRRGGRTEDAQMWEEKAQEIDYGDQNKWRDRVANSIIASPWGANEAIIDKIVENHKKEAAVLQKTQDIRRQVLSEKHKRRRFALENTILAEKQRMRLQVKKLYDREMAAIHKESEKLDEGSDAGDDGDEGATPGADALYAGLMVNGDDEASFTDSYGRPQTAPQLGSPGFENATPGPTPRPPTSPAPPSASSPGGTQSSSKGSPSPPPAKKYLDPKPPVLRDPIEMEQMILKVRQASLGRDADATAAMSLLGANLAAGANPSGVHAKRDWNTQGAFSPDDWQPQTTKPTKKNSYEFKPAPVPAAPNVNLARGNDTVKTRAGSKGSRDFSASAEYQKELLKIQQQQQQEEQQEEQQRQQQQQHQQQSKQQPQLHQQQQPASAAAANAKARMDKDAERYFKAMSEIDKQFGFAPDVGEYWNDQNEGGTGGSFSGGGNVGGDGSGGAQFHIDVSGGGFDAGSYGQGMGQDQGVGGGMMWGDVSYGNGAGPLSPMPGGAYMSNDAGYTPGHPLSLQTARPPDSPVPSNHQPAFRAGRVHGGGGGGGGGPHGGFPLEVDDDDDDRP